MDVIIYLIVFLIFISLALLVLQVLAPFLFILAIVVAVYMLYIRYKAKKNIDDFNKDIEKMNESFSQSYTEKKNHGDVIDVEYTEHDVDDV